MVTRKTRRWARKRTKRRKKEEEEDQEEKGGGGGQQDQIVYKARVFQEVMGLCA